MSSFSIKSWSDEDKPRERLRDHGRRYLSNAELIAILIGSGNKNESAVVLAKKILASVNNDLYALDKLSIKDYTKFNGIGPAKAISIIAGLELGRRRKSKMPKEESPITSSQVVFEEMYPMIGELNHEEFWVIYLNNAHKIIYKSQLSKGGITSTLVDIRLLLKNAILHNATALILIHNHPSGNLKPSKEDIKLTEKVNKACQQMELKLLDHIILASQNYFSFADKGIL